MKGNDIMKMPKETRKAVKRLMNYLLKEQRSFEAHYYDLIGAFKIIIVNNKLDYEKIKELVNSAQCSVTNVTNSSTITYNFDWSENYD